jgi:hypothetical protein
MPIKKTKKQKTMYLKDDTLKKSIVPFRYYNGGVVRCAQASEAGHRAGGPKRVLNFCCTKF